MPGAIEIQTERSSYRVGEEVRGTLTVSDDVPTARSLKVSLWHEGNRLATEQAASQTLHEGPLLAGESFPFQLSIPLHSPPDFKGQAHELHWYVWGTMDVPWALDPSGRQPIEVGPMEVGARSELGPMPPVPKVEMTLGGKLVVGCVVACLIVPLLALAILFFPVALILIVKRWLVSARIRSFHVEPGVEQGLLGEWVPVTVGFDLVKPVDVEKLAVSLVGTEHWTTGSGKHQQHHYHRFHEAEQAFLEDCYLAPDPQAPERSFRLQAAVQVPPAGLPSMGGSIYYDLAARLYLRGWPDPSATKRLPVLGIRLAEPARPATPSAGRASRGILVIPHGEPAPSGVDLSQARESVWIWVALAGIGLPMAILGAALRYGAHQWDYHLFSVGLGVFLAGAVVLLWKMVR